MNDAAGNEGEDFIYTGQESRDIPWDVTRVRGHRSVRAIKAEAFRSHTQLTHVYLGDCEELEEIGEAAFWECTSLHDIVIPPPVKRIKRGAFYHCRRLTNVHLGDCEELEEIGELAFCVCSSLRDIAIPPAVKEIGELAFCVCTLLREIVIPPSVKVIHKEAFLRCSNLTNVRFCDEIEEFVSGVSMRDWWNHGVHERSLSRYVLLSCPMQFQSGWVSYE
jgi:hypothetical protein